MSPAVHAPGSLPAPIESDAAGADSAVLPLLLGSTGEAVTDLQLRLVRLGLPTGEDATGELGPGTADAVATFQQLRGLRPDGVCGRDTWAAREEKRNKV